MALKMSRRGFVKASAVATASTLLLGSQSGTALADSAQGASDAARPDDVKKIPSACRQCYGRCALFGHVKDGRVVKIEGNPDLFSEGTLCSRAFAIPQELYNPLRVRYPQKRVGEKGSGQWKRITWEEAYQEAADRFTKIGEEYGWHTIAHQYGTGRDMLQFQAINKLWLELGSTATFGVGNLCWVGSYFTSQRLYGDETQYTGWDGNNTNCILIWCRQERSRGYYDWLTVKRAQERGAKVICVDPRYTCTASKADLWLPIRPGTDAALASAIAHEWIANDQVDKGFLDEYCVGYDEGTMPESAKGQNKSYKDYIMGTGYDMVEKTAEWAAPITGIPAERIKQLAADIAAAEAPFICQGWGPQRHTNGEDTSRAICMLPVLIGKIGLPGTNTGQREAEPPTYLVGSLPFENPIKTAIPVYQWINAVDHGKEMTATNAGIVGADKLNNDIKFLWNYAGNCITNQHGDINYTHDVLADESKLEFILVWDTVMTDSAKYADILLPDAMRSEQLNMQTQGYSEYYTAVVVGGPAQEAPGECRSSYDVCADIADKFGKKDAFTEGKTQEDWIKELYEAGAKADGNMPTWDEIKEQGVYKRPLEPAIGLVDFRTDPVKNPLSTPSGKIEIYSEQLAEIAATWELEEGDVINPIPVFTPGFQGYGSVTDEYPLYCTGFHHKSRTHSSFGFIPELEQVARQQLWINPADAESRGIASGDTVAVKSPAGEIRIEALVTPRIIPGTIGIPQGAWHKADMNGDRVDEGACVNTLTTYRPTPLAKGNGPAHSIIAQITKA